MTKRILITGGLGFLGHFLSRALLNAFPDCELTIVDNLSSSQIDYEWLAGKAEIHKVDLRTWNPSHSHFDQIYHLASPVGSIGILEKTGYVASEITELAVRAGEIAARSHASLLYVSSSEIYGKAGKQSEEDELIVPLKTGTRMEYSLGKLSAEHILHNLAARFYFPVKVCRPFNVLGEHQSSRIGFVVPTFFERALGGLDMPLFHGGGQRRSFCDVRDAVQGLISIQEKGRPGEVYNLGNPHNLVTIRELALKIKEICSSASPLKEVDPVAIFGPHYIEAFDKVPRIEKIIAHTGWTPTTPLDEVLPRIHGWYKRVLQAQETLVLRNDLSIHKGVGFSSITQTNGLSPA